MPIAPRSVVADIVAARIDPINAFGILQRFPKVIAVAEGGDDRHFGALPFCPKTDVDSVFM
jgi:hypothetical protein